MALAEKPRKKSLAEIREARAKAGRASGLARTRGKSYKQLQKELVREHIDQRLMSATDAMLDSQISLARGLSFLYRIDKTFVRTGSSKSTGEPEGYYRNEKPVLVESRAEIEAYLEELADNNGDLSDQNDESAAYYFITTKEPNMAAITDAHNRVHGKPKETLDVNQHHTFSLIALGKRRAMLDGNKDLTVLDAPIPKLIAP